MSYTIIETDTGIKMIVEGNVSIPVDAENRHFQKVLDSINTDGADAWDDTVSTYDDIPEDLRTAAETKQFAQQLQDYKQALKRLSQYALADGREEIKESVVVAKTWDEELNDYIETTEEQIIQTAIDPAPATITRLVFDETDPDADPVEQTIDNPDIAKDNEERAAAQAVVDATPQAVKDAVE